MIIYKNSSTDPFFNLAAEQYLLDTKQGEIFMLWRNSRSVIIGKNQNAYAELDMDYAEKNNISVVRRLTGGGAVFHDVGNVNFSFIVDEECAALDFARFTNPIINAVSALGVKDICLSGRNDILIEGAKVSGNAQSRYNNKTLHHGTLLYSADLSMLTGALKVDPEKIKAKGIKSVRNRVGNIKDYIDNSMDTEAFMAYIEEHIVKNTGAEIRYFLEDDKAHIQRLADEKYSTWEWNFGRSKEFNAQKKNRYPFGSVEVSLHIEKGIIENVKIQGDFFGMKDISVIEQQLVGTRFEKNDLRSRLDEKTLGECIAGMDTELFLQLLMS